MPEENIEAARRAIEAFNDRDIGRFLAECDPEIEFHSALWTWEAFTGATSGSDAGTRT
jgi:hypothetical protein